MRISDWSSDVCSSDRFVPGPLGIIVAMFVALIWGWAFLRRHDDTPLVAADRDPLTLAAVTPSQRALGKYLFVVLALFIFQVFIGGFTAHYTIEGQSFYGIDVSQYFQIGRAHV